jgi:hypothetical protein
MTDLCQACERNRAEVVEPCDDPKTEYKVCPVCHRPLKALALRPLEWYNLSKRHGCGQFLLHDDFYDESGIAQQAGDAVEAPEKYPAPTLAEVCHAAEALLDYSIAHMNFSAEAQAWRRISHSEILAAISNRFAATKDADVRSAIFDVCGGALGESGAEFVRFAGNDLGKTTLLSSLAIASMKCLPNREGFDRVSAALTELDARQKLQEMWCLGLFHTPETLDWIEKNIVEPITESWGYLAAASKFDWQRAEKWLEGGRPLSLVALDALLAIAKPMSPFLQAYAPSLIEPPTPSRFLRTLSAYRRRDPVPRVEKRTDALVAKADILCHGP